MFVECGVALGPTLEAVESAVLCACVLSASTIVYRAPRVGGSAQVEPWACLDVVMQRVLYNADKENTLEAEREGVVSFMPSLVWAFEGSAPAESAAPASD